MLYRIDYELTLGKRIIPISDVVDVEDEDAAMDHGETVCWHKRAIDGIDAAEVTEVTKL